MSRHVLEIASMTGFDISLLRPIWLVALLPLAFIGWALLRQRSRLGSWEQVANPELLRAMHALGRIDRGTGLRRDLLALVISGIAVLALTGPAPLNCIGTKFPGWVR